MSSLSLYSFLDLQVADRDLTFQGLPVSLHTISIFLVLHYPYQLSHPPSHKPYLYSTKEQPSSLAYPASISAYPLVPSSASNATYHHTCQLHPSKMSSSPPSILTHSQPPMSSSPGRPSSNTTHCWLTRKERNKLAHTTNGNRPGKVTVATGYWNCGKGLLDSNNFSTAKLAEIEHFISDNNLDILIVAEAGLHGRKSRIIRSYPVTSTIIRTALRIPGFQILLPESWELHETARLIMYVSDNIQVKQVSTPVLVSDLPIINIEVKKGKAAPTLVSGYYREFTGGISGIKTPEAQLERLVRLTEVWKYLDTLGKDTIIMGDTNLCYRNWSVPGAPQQPLINRVKEVQAAAALHQMVDTDTRMQVVDGVLERSIIDHVFTNCSSRIMPVEVIAVGSSDHLGLVARKLTRVQHIHPRTFRVRDHKGMNDLISSLVANNVNNLVTTCNSLEDASTTFTRELRYYSDIHIPIKTIAVKGQAKPFVSMPTKDLIRAKSDALSNAKATNQPQDFVEYKSLAKLVKQAVKEDRDKWIEEDLGKRASPKIAWSRARSLLGQSSASCPTNINHNGNIVTNPTKIANAFAHLHKDKVKELRNQANKTPSQPPANRVRKLLARRKQPPPTFSLKPINHLKLAELLRRLKPGKGLPSDLIDGATIKHTATVLKDALLHLVNLSITSGSFASNWKSQTMSPRHKKGDKADLGNYRPVSTLVEVAKLTEMAVHDQVRDHFVLNNLLHPAHHGSVPGLDTTTALLAVQKFALDAAESRMMTGTVMLDQSSAFDIMDHEIFLEKLEAYKFDQNAVNWFASYLANRSFLVQIESKRSCELSTGPYGVPQGSILGSLLFVISQNDLPDASTDLEDDDGQTVCFVDDETEQVSHSNPVQLQAMLQRRVDNATTWLSDNKMVISPSKTKLMVSMTKELRATRHYNLSINIKVNNLIISPTPSEKLLGVTLNQDMTWATYLWGETWRQTNNQQGLVPILLQRLALLKHLSRLSSKSKMLSFIPALFTSKIRYALPLIGSMWGLGGYTTQEPQKVAFTKNDITRLQSLQRSAATLALPHDPDRYKQSTATLLSEVSWPSIHQMIASTTLQLLIRIRRTRKPEDLYLLLTDPPTGRTRSRQIQPPRAKLNLTLEAFTNQAIRLLNLLPDDFLSNQSKSSLKVSIIRWVKDNIKVKV